MARWAQRWSNSLLVLSAVVMLLIALMAVTHSFSPLSASALQWVIYLGIGVQISALSAVMLEVIFGLSLAVQSYRGFGAACQDEIVDDYQRAAQLASYPVSTLDAVDRWLEHKVKRMERRQLRFFGGSDKLAIVALMVAAWTTWKEVGSALLSWQPSPLLFGVAFALGLAIGGLLASRLMDRLNDQRSLLQIAKSLKVSMERPA